MFKVSQVFGWFESWKWGEKVINIVLILISMILLMKYWSLNFNTYHPRGGFSSSKKAVPKSACAGEDLVDPYSANIGHENKGKHLADKFPNLLGDVLEALAGSGEFEVTEVEDMKVGDYLVDLRVENDPNSEGKKVIVKKFSKLEENAGDF
tara:strand:- start:507 stop:959 length:453 start_codon:yes stop_codon:yes gene_type:complete